ncbi:DegT/DnrJ/EryC1/StrS family aminotransferase [Candidatus Woesebacteria bacterium]|nr:DegT/DnrJ/EryC1/StrS family aminotransferase [Candidatus Woesebacteria bacterium]
MNKIPLTRPLFGREELKAVGNVLDSGWVTQGPRVNEFEDAVCAYTGAKYGVATTSATTSLFLSLYLLGIGPGDEVIVPSFSFIATANVVVHVGAKPVFIDIDPNTYNLDPKLIEKLITKKTKAIIPVDQVGLPAEHDLIKKIANKHNLHIVEDAACALGSSYNGKKIGSFSELTGLSFHPRKCVTTGEGGMILTNNLGYARKLKMLRHHGMAISDVARNVSNKVIHETYPFIGFNFRITDIQAAVGVEQLKRLDAILESRNKKAEVYTNAFTNSKNIIPPFVPKNVIPNWQSYIIRLRKNKKIKRDGLMQKLFDFGIASRRGVMSSHLETPYKKMYPKLRLAESEAASLETLTIPLFPQMTKKEQAFVIKKILEFTE